MAKKAVTSNEIKFPVVRLAFSDSLFVPDYFTPGKPKDDKEVPMHRLQLLLDPSNEAHAKAIKEVKSEGERIANEFWEDKPPKKLGHGYGDETDLNKVYDGFKGMFWIRLASKDPFPIVGRRKDAKTGKFVPLKKGDPEAPYAGCFVNAKGTLWTQDSHGRVGINGNILTMQFVKDGPEFGRPQADPDDSFDSLPEEEGESVFDEDTTSDFG